jgi:hypothetical protein
MQKEIIEMRIKELTEAIDRSAANHNALLGRINEAREILKMIEEQGDVVDGVSTEVKS